jgi:polysaccharide biosynthesis/export protein
VSRGLHTSTVPAVTLLLGIAAAGAQTLPQAPAAAKAVTATPTREQYTVGPGDVLQIVVRKEPELSRDALVRIDGRITVPLLGELEAAGRTPKEISEDIVRGLARFVNAPSVTVAVGQATSIRAYVIGQVVRSGEIPLAVPLNVVQALALCGGFKEFAKKDSILVVGRDGKVTPFDYKKFESGRDLEQNVGLKPGDTIVVP